MHKIFITLLVLYTSISTSRAQLTGKQLPANNLPSLSKQDTTKLPLQQSSEFEPESIPIVSLNESDLDDKSIPDVSSWLVAGRDIFSNIAAYSFGITRFKIRGYEADLFPINLNGAIIENLKNGYSMASLWSGLNDIMRYRDVTVGLQPNTFSFGSIGGCTNIDASASKQRKQTQIGYSFSNRNYRHRITYMKGAGVNDKGWAFSLNGSLRWAEEGYTPGSYYMGWSVCIGIDKHISNKHVLSLLIFNAPTEIGKQGASTEEALELAGTHYYNPCWGFQNGRKRNANVVRTNQPVFIFTHNFKINNKSNLVTAVSYLWSNRSTSGLDWFNAADPRPDYYQYLPSYYKDDAGLDQLVEEKWKNNEETRQINWAKLYDANRVSVETFNGVTGHRAHYLLQEDVVKTRQMGFNTVFNQKLGNRTVLTMGISYQAQKDNNYRKITDLLGGDYFVDLNQFAERDFPLDTNVTQNDLNRPNRIVKVGDRYGYDYDVHINKAAAWIQGLIKLRKFDFFIAFTTSNTRYWRIGNVKNGLFPNNSYGKSIVNNFNNYAIKMGLTYKINGRNYLYINGAGITKAPYFQNIYMSPRTRDTRQNSINNEQIRTLEGGYVLNAPKIKLRISGYYSTFDHQLDIKSFYHDEYRSFVNLAITNINQLHLGSEVGFEVKVLPDVSVSGAAAIARYFYNSRQYLNLTVDNNAAVLPPDIAYTNNYRVGATPQEAYNLSITYRAANYWLISIAGNLFNKMWTDINPIRRTYKAVEDAGYNSNERHAILAQQQLKEQYTLNFYCSYSKKLPRKLCICRKTSNYIVFSGSVSNLLNNKNICGGYEQLRYDFTTQSVDKFPSKYYYAYGINCFVSTAIRF